VILVPPLYVASQELLNRLAAYVKEGGHIVMSFKSGFTNEYSAVRWERAPGPLRDAAGFHYQEFSSLTERLSLKDDPYGVGKENYVSVWAEFLIPETASALATYNHPFFGQYPAITRNQHGEGSLTYQGTFLSDALQREVILEVLKEASISLPDQELPEAISVRHGRSRAGEVLHFYLNYSNDAQRFGYRHGTGKDLLTGQTVAEGQNISLQAWDLVIIFED
jgi:beta-galactosidase